MTEKENILELATDLAAAFVSNNQIAAAEIPDLIENIFDAMVSLLEREPGVLDEKPVPAVPIEDSITDDYIICLEDGQKYKSLKRHLRTKFELTPKAYREKWGLPLDYPMVAPNYSIERSRLAKRTGLGKS